MLRLPTFTHVQPRSLAITLLLLCILACRDMTGAKAPVPLLLTDIAAGYYATCGLAPDGAAYCWGNGREGQLGFAAVEECSSIPGEDPCAHTPRRVAGGHTFTSITAGGAHFCAVTSPGEVHCWGDDRFGQLGTLDTAAFCGLFAEPCARVPQLAYLPPPATAVPPETRTPAPSWTLRTAGAMGSAGVLPPARAPTSNSPASSPRA